ncbi:glycosyltransferase [candidate division KSB1 bacterium]|nr:glycosyltransferase [candidate division KSB1 bacterium]
MKIKYFHQGLWPSNSPSTTFVTFNTLGFYKNNYNFELIITRNSKENKQVTLKTKFDIKESLPIHLLNAGPLKRKHPIVYLLAISYLLNKEFDVLITRNLSFLSYALILKKIKKFKLIYESHDFYSDLKLRNNVREKPPYKQMKQEHKYLPRVDAIICVSEVQKQYYLRYYPEKKILTAVTGIKTHLNYLPKTGFSYNIGYIGALDLRDYDLDFLLRVFSNVKNNKINLIIAGAKNDREYNKIKGIVDQYKLSSRVTIKSWMSPKQVEKLKSEIDIGCAPMIKNERNKICSPLKVLEYLSAGIPALATNLEGIEYIIKNGKNGFTMDNDPGKWAALIDKLYSNFEFYHKLSVGCLETARHFSWEQRTRTIHNFLETEFNF